MLLVPSATQVERTDTGADDLLCRLAVLLPEAWIAVGAVASKPISDSCSRGHTRQFDGIIIGERLIFVLDIWSHADRPENPQKFGFFARLHDQPDLADEAWQSFRRETEKLKALLQERFEVEPGRVVPDRIASRAQRSVSAGAAASASTANLRSFARAATRQDRNAGFPPLRTRMVDRIAAFLGSEAKAADLGRSHPTLSFTDEGPLPAVIERSRAAPAPDPPARAASSKDMPPPARPSNLPQPQLSLRRGTTIAPPATPARIAAPEQAPDSTIKADIAKPLLADAAGPAAATPMGASDSPQGELLLQQEIPLARPATPPRITAPGPAADTSPSLAQAVASRVLALPGRRATAQRKWLGGLLVVLLVLQAGAIGWLALFDHASPHPKPASAAGPAEVGPMPTPFVVRSLATSEPMLVGSKKAILRAGPSPDFPAVGVLAAGTQVVASASAGGPGGSHWTEVKAVNGAIGFVPADRVQSRPAPAIERTARPQPTPSPTPTMARAEAPRATPPPKIARAVSPKQVSSPKIARAAAPKLTPTPKIEQAAAPKRTPSPKSPRVVAPKQTTTPKITRAVAPKHATGPKVERATKPAQRTRPTASPDAPRVACILPGGKEIQATHADCRAQSGIIYQ